MLYLLKDISIRILSLVMCDGYSNAIYYHVRLRDVRGSLVVPIQHSGDHLLPLHAIGVLFRDEGLLGASVPLRSMTTYVLGQELGRQDD
jgi:hypothetical protein